MKTFLWIAALSMVGLLSCNTPTEPAKDAAATTATTDTTAQKSVDKKIIVFFGNSLTAAYGLDPAKGFVGLISNRIDSLGLPYKVVNAGLSGETTAGGNSRIDWILQQQSIDIFVLELGGNDGLRGIDPKSSKVNLQSIIDKVKAKFPAVKIIIAGMEAPPNMGKTYTSAFRGMYPDLAKTNHILLIPFLLVNVGGEASLNQADGIHPNETGCYIVRETVWKTLKEVL